jgi:UDP-N-acetylglucosamine--N-acetylmuramyl-(pentapeptide) pyrophosphoryl-undecaprenol N-acetylglucosamine transferase
VQRPAIFVPSPNVTDDHQTANAMSLVKENAALLVKDAEARTQLVSAAIALLQDKAQQKTLVEHIAKMSITNAADRIATAVIGITKTGKN